MQTHKPRPPAGMLPAKLLTGASTLRSADLPMPLSDISMMLSDALFIFSAPPRDLFPGGGMRAGNLRAGFAAGGMGFALEDGARFHGVQSRFEDHVGALKERKRHGHSGVAQELHFS